MLDIDTFTSCFSTFCFLTYSDRVLGADEKIILRYIEECFQLTDCTCSPKDFLKDLLESICIMMRDGDQVTFTHRSFQEYFCAAFLVNNRSGSHFDLIEAVAMRSPQDGVIPMIMGINQEHLEREWVLPVVKRTLTIWRSAEEELRKSTFASSVFESVVTSENGTIIGIPWRNSLSSGIMQIEQLYSEPRPKPRPPKSRRAKSTMKSAPAKPPIVREAKDLQLRPSQEHEALISGWFGDWLLSIIHLFELLETKLSDRYERRESSLRQIINRKNQ